jgi:hypothetical protein
LGAKYPTAETDPVAGAAVTAETLARQAADLLKQDTSTASTDAERDAAIAAAASQAGTLASRPTAAAGNLGLLYFATDDNGGTLYRSTGSAWTKLGRPLLAQTLTGVTDDGSAAISGGVVTPGSDTENGIVVRRPDSAYGQAQVYGQAQAFLLIKEGTGSVHNALVLARIDGRTGGAGFTGGLHVPLGLHQDGDFAVPATGAVWIQPQVDAPMLTGNAPPGSPTSDLVNLSDNTAATVLFKIDSAGRPSNNTNIGTHFHPFYLGSASASGANNANSLFLEAITVPWGVTLTGIKYYVGSVSNGNVKVGLYNSAGTLVASSGSVAQATANNLQAVPFSSTYAAKQGLYYIGIVNSSATGTYWLNNGVSPANSQAAGSFNLPAGPTLPPNNASNVGVPVVTTY